MVRRVRHHTGDEGLEKIRASGGIHAWRGWGLFESGVHVEVEPFGPAAPATEEGQSSPKNDLGSYREGAFVEFDAPAELIDYSCGKRRSGIIPLPTGALLHLENYRPRYVNVRQFWWQFWRTSVE